MEKECIFVPTVGESLVGYLCGIVGLANGAQKDELREEVSGESLCLADSGWQSSHERGPNVGTDRLASCWGAMGLTFVL